MDNMQGPPLEMIFGNYMAWKLDEKTWVISFMEGKEYIYLLEGKEKALLLDTGYGIGHLRAFVETLTDKPVIVANTHFHPDHSAGNGEWEKEKQGRYGIFFDHPAADDPDESVHADCLSVVRLSVCC